MRPGGRPLHFRRMHDKKVCLLGLTAVMTCPAEALTPELLMGLPQVMGGAMRMLVALKEQQVRGG